MSNTLVELSNDLAAAVAAAGNSVVRVEARRRLPASGFVWSTDGVIVTAHHVVEQDEDIRVGLPSGETAPANLIGRDPATDLAALRVQRIPLPAAARVQPGSVAVGHLVLAVGRPGARVMATLGVIGALGEGWRTAAGGRIDQYIQPDVTMYPGLSGGPLVSASGPVVGLNTTGLLRGQVIAIPMPTIARVVEELLVHGKVRRGHLGVGVQPARLPRAIAEQLGRETGLLVISVEPGSPAERAGLLLGDTLVSFGGEPVRFPDALLALLGGDRIGTEAALQVVRGGRVQELKATIGERP